MCMYLSVTRAVQDLDFRSWFVVDTSITVFTGPMCTYFACTWHVQKLGLRSWLVMDTCITAFSIPTYTYFTGTFANPNLHIRPWLVVRINPRAVSTRMRTYFAGTRAIQNLHIRSWLVIRINPTTVSVGMCSSLPRASRSRITLSFIRCGRFLIRVSNSQACGAIESVAQCTVKADCYYRIQLESPALNCMLCFATLKLLCRS